MLGSTFPQTLYEHQTNLEKRLAEARADCEALEKRLANDQYVAKAPPELVEQSREQLKTKRGLAERLARELQVISDDSSESSQL